MHLDILSMPLTAEDLIWRAFRELMSPTPEAKILPRVLQRRTPLVAIVLLWKRNRGGIGAKLALLARPRPTWAVFKAIVNKARNATVKCQSRLYLYCKQSQYKLFLIRRLNWRAEPKNLRFRSERQWPPFRNGGISPYKKSLITEHIVF